MALCTVAFLPMLLPDMPTLESGALPSEAGPDLTAKAFVFVLSQRILVLLASPNGVLLSLRKIALALAWVSELDPVTRLWITPSPYSCRAVTDFSPVSEAFRTP